MKSQTPIFFTKAGLDNLAAEKESLLKERPLAVEDLAKARAMGDLSENGYYKGARAKLSALDRRIREVTYLLRVGKVKEPLGKGLIDVGTTVLLRAGTMQKTYIIVGGYESNPSEGKLSYISPLGKALIGKKEGDKVTIHTPSGDTTYTILSLA